MNNNGWITYRLPTKDDAVAGRVLISCVQNEVYTKQWENVQRSEPWQRLPAPYVKPKRWVVDWIYYCNCYVITDGELRIYLYQLQSRDDVQRICDIYNEVLP